jgi:hypothetical protein
MCFNSVAVSTPYFTLCNFVYQSLI